MAGFRFLALLQTLRGFARGHRRTATATGRPRSCDPWGSVDSFLSDLGEEPPNLINSHVNVLDFAFGFEIEQESS